eukprot:889014-Prorocentrum_minimum.AAC.1
MNCMGKPEARKAASRWEVGSRRGKRGKAKDRSCAARSVSDCGGWFTSLVLTEKHQQFADGADDVVIKLTRQAVVGPTA